MNEPTPAAGNAAPVSLKYSDDDLNVIMQDWDALDPTQLVAINLARELATLRSALAQQQGAANWHRLLTAAELMESVYRLNVVQPGEPSSVLENLQAAIAAIAAPPTSASQCGHPYRKDGAGYPECHCETADDCPYESTPQPAAGGQDDTLQADMNEYAEALADARDASAFRWVSERAWFVDAGAYAFDLRFGPGDFTTEPRNADADDVRKAIFDAMHEDDVAAAMKGASHE